MAEVTMLVCDVDPLPGQVVRRYEVTVEGKTSTLDLCDEHAGVFAPKALSKPRPAPARKATSSRRKVRTMAEVEKLKR